MEDDQSSLEAELKAQPSLGKVMSFSILGCAHFVCSVALEADAIVVRGDADTIAFQLTEQNGPIANARAAVLRREGAHTFLLESGAYRVRLTEGADDAAPFKIEVLAVASRAGDLGSLSFKNAHAEWNTHYFAGNGPAMFDQLDLPQTDMGTVVRKEFGADGDPIFLSSMRYKHGSAVVHVKLDHGVTMTNNHARLVNVTKNAFTMQRSVRGAEARALFDVLPRGGAEGTRGFELATKEAETSGALSCTLAPAPKGVATVTTLRPLSARDDKPRHVAWHDLESRCAAPPTSRSPACSLCCSLVDVPRPPRRARGVRCHRRRRSPSLARRDRATRARETRARGAGAARRCGRSARARRGPARTRPAPGAGRRRTHLHHAPRRRGGRRALACRELRRRARRVRGRAREGGHARRTLRGRRRPASALLDPSDRDEARLSDWKENPQALVLAPVHTVVDRAMEVAGETTRVFPTTEIGIAQAPPEHPRPSPFTVGYWIDPGAPYALVLRVRRSGVGGSFVVRRGGALDALPVDRAGGCDGVKLAISERGIEVRARLAPPSPRDVDRTITADDGTCVAVPRTPAGHDLARLAAVLRALKPLLASCSGDSAAGASEAVTVVSALADTPWLDVASVLAVADDETNGTRLGFPSERPSLACEGALRVSDLPSAALPTVPSATVK